MYTAGLFDKKKQEIEGKGYHRMPIPPDWFVLQGDERITTPQITFPEAGDNWGEVAHYGIFSGNGKLLLLIKIYDVHEIGALCTVSIIGGIEVFPIGDPSFSTDLSAEKKPAKPSIAVIGYQQNCPSCGWINPVGALTCYNCGYI